MMTHHSVSYDETKDIGGDMQTRGHGGGICYG